MSINARQQAEVVVERVLLALEHLCVSNGDVRDRLLGAVESLLALKSSDFPEHLRSDFNWIIEQSTKYESVHPDRYSYLEVTMRKIRNSTGSKIASRIFFLYSEIQDIRGFPLLEFREPDK